MHIKSYIKFLEVLYNSKKPLSRAGIGRGMGVNHQHLHFVLSFAKEKNHIDIHNSIDARIKETYAINRRGKEFYQLLI